MLALSTLAGRAQSGPQQQAAIPIEDLKGAYLACDRAATRTVPDGAAVSLCSRNAEELLRRGFGGDVDTLLGWWRKAKEAPEAKYGAEPASGPSESELPGQTSRH
ncbi:hypothetical protein QTI66_37240 [Variovorax sp. J22R133]|uniref:hypothetical protein n=1 Tax=Variovorax brevis TaxID=3053503 RepID=UPI002575604E|nr:hypothetical protein [Variovorax sp. J22R133]MDM0117747.1 hypothetical protein [Variovorax sp. J22R133]